MVKLPPAPKIFSIILLILFKILYLLIFSTLFFFSECLTVLPQAVPSTVEIKRHTSPMPCKPAIELCLK